MRNHRRISVFLALASLLVLAGCSGGSQTEAPPQTGETSDAGRPASTLPIPGEGSQMPPGHPPAGGAGRLVWALPEGWAEVPPASNMRYAQYAVTGPAGDGECIVYYFGPNQGGDAMANAQRWAGQFSQPDGRSSLELMTVTEVEGAAVPVKLVEVTGTYDGGMTMTAAPAESKPGYMLLGGIADGPDAPWFFKFTGPEETVRAQRDAFVEMMSSIRVEG